MHGRASPTPDQVPGTIAPARGRATLTARTLPSAPLAGDVIQFDRVTKTYHAGSPPALAEVSMSVAAGEAVAVTGPSGSGKSTLLNMIAGLDKPTSGTVSAAGRRIDNPGEVALARFRARHVGIIFQFFNLLEDLTVEDNVLLPAQLAGAARRKAKARAGERPERMGIAGLRDEYPARMSGGQRQRVAIARAPVNDPSGEGCCPWWHWPSRSSPPCSRRPGRHAPARRPRCARNEPGEAASG